MNFDKKNLPPKYETPLAYPIGWVAICFSIIPLLMAVNDKNKLAIIIGLTMLGIGLLLLAIGKVYSMIFLKKSVKKN